MSADPKYKLVRGDEVIYCATEGEMLRTQRTGDRLYYQAIFGWMYVPTQQEHARMPQLSDWQ
jgi:hypothetical protein